MPLSLSLDNLRPAPYNPRRISEENAAALRYSLNEFGDLSGIVWNRRTGFLVTGHQRLDALKREHGSALVIHADEDGVGAVIVAHGQHFPVRVVDWDEAKERAANVVANSPMLAGEFTADLEGLLAQIAEDSPAIVDELRLDELMAFIDPPSMPGATSVERSTETTRTTTTTETVTTPQIEGMQYQVVVTTRDEHEQASICAELEGRGLSCRLLTL